MALTQRITRHLLVFLLGFGGWFLPLTEAWAEAAVTDMPALLRPTGVSDIRLVPPSKASQQAGYCLLDRVYEKDFRLQLALARDGAINLGLYIPRAGLGSGDSYPVVLQIDQNLRRKVIAEAKTENLLVMNLQKDPAFLTALSSGMQLIAIGELDHTSFALQGLAVGLNDLKICVNDLKAHALDYAAAEVWPESLGALLRTAGLKAMTPLPLNDIPANQRPTDYAWRIGKLVGGVREQLVQPNSKLPLIVKDYNAAFKNKCQGKFVEKSEPAIMAGSVQMQNGTIVCEMTDRSIFVATIHTLTKDGVFTLYLHQGELTEARNAVKARDAIAKTLKSFYAHEALGRPTATKTPPTNATQSHSKQPLR
jgi:hypothetical protein